MDRIFVIVLLCFTSTAFGIDGHGGDGPSTFCIYNIGNEEIQLLQTTTDSYHPVSTVFTLKPNEHKEIKEHPNILSVRVFTQNQNTKKQECFQLRLKKQTQKILFDPVTKTFKTDA